ncbi:MAG: DUF3822 family protein [Bacteroidales bacterium]|nr:DUF3822 family protein [Bacteroidales bacterium]
MFGEIKKRISLNNLDLKSSFTGKYQISIELSLDGFSYCLLDSERFQYLVLESYSFKEVMSYEDLSRIAEFLVDISPIKRLPRQRISLIFKNNQSCMVASPLFIENEKASYFSFHHSLKEGHDIFADKLNNLSAYNVYSLPVVVVDKFKSLFEDIRIRHYSSTLIENLCYYYKAGFFHQNVVLHVQDKHFEILLFNGADLILYNTFPYSTWEDLLYYVLYVLEQLEITPEKSDVLILGEIAMDSNSFQNIKSFMHSVDFGGRTDFFKYDHVFEEIPHHFYFNLLNVNACG